MNKMAQRKTTSKDAVSEVDDKMREDTDVDLVDRKKAISKLERKIYKDLHFVEIAVYCCVWLGSIAYSVHLFHLESEKRRSAFVYVRKYNPWWNILPDPLIQDQSDHEWQTWKLICSYPVAFISAVAYPFISQLVKRVSLRWNTLFTAVYSIIWTINLVGLYPVLYMMLQLCIIFSVYLITGKAILVWVVAIAYSQFKMRLDDYVFSNQDWAFSGYLTSVAGAWMNSRCVSFSLDRIWGTVAKESSILESFLNLTAYCFYLPLGIMGALITSKQFKEAMETKHQFNAKLLKFTILEGLKYFGWFLATELLLSYVYQQSFTQKPFFVDSMNMWELCGMCFLLGQFFNMKYVMMYGTSGYLAKLDNIDAPPHPKWIGRIHLYSDMWRHFDVGLYHFMHIYIYTPLTATIDTNNFIVRMGITCVIFAFVYVWHGVQDFILVWSVLNCFGILCESIAREIGKSQTYIKLESGLLSGQGQRRFHALISSPLFLMSCLSNFYFFTGMQVGNIIVRRIFTDTWPNGFPYLMFVLYTGAHFSIQVRNWELRKEIQDLKQKYKLS